jgi:hypothetical protein
MEFLRSTFCNQVLEDISHHDHLQVRNIVHTVRAGKKAYFHCDLAHKGYCAPYHLGLGMLLFHFSKVHPSTSTFFLSTRTENYWQIVLANSIVVAISVLVAYEHAIFPAVVETIRSRPKRLMGIFLDSIDDCLDLIRSC